MPEVVRLARPRPAGTVSEPVLLALAAGALLAAAQRPPRVPEPS